MRPARPSADARILLSSRGATVVAARWKKARDKGLPGQMIGAGFFLAILALRPHTGCRDCDHLQVELTVGVHQAVERKRAIPAAGVGHDPYDRAFQGDRLSSP